MLLAVAFALLQDRGLTFGEDGSTVPAGQVRTTAVFRVRRWPDGSTLAHVPAIQADLGLNEWAELGLEWDARVLLGSPEFTDRLGPGDPTWRLKIVPLRKDGWAAGGILAFKLPSAEDKHGTGSDTGDAHVRLLASYSWDQWTAGATVGLAVLGDRDEFSNVDPMFVWSGWLRWHSAPWTVAAELHGSEGPRFSATAGEGVFGDGWISGRIGVSRTLEAWEFGLAFEIGISDEAPEYELLAFVSRSWEVFDGAGEALPEAGFSDVLPMRRAEAGPSAISLGFGAREQSDDSHLLTGARVSVLVGLGPRADLRLTGDARWLRDSPEFDDDGGLGDFWAEARWVPLRIDAWRAGMAFAGKIPMQGRRRGLTTGGVDWVVRLLGSWVPSAWAVHVNVGFAVNDFPFQRNSQTDALLWGMAAEHGFSPLLSATVALDGTIGAKKLADISQGWAGRGMVSARAALQWRPTPAAPEFSISGAAGIVPESPEWELDAGVSFRLGDREIGR